MTRRLSICAAWLTAAALSGCSVPGMTIPGLTGSTPPADPQVCAGLRNTATTGALGNKTSQENAVREMQRRGCPDIPTL
jgi:hypothetical protein